MIGLAIMIRQRNVNGHHHTTDNPLLIIIIIIIIIIITIKLINYIIIRTI